LCSVRADGKAYVDNQLFDRSALADAPKWLYDLIGSKPNTPPPPPDNESELFPPGFGLDPLFPFTPANEAKLKTALSVIPATARGT
jgi:hypothetical protein